MTMSVHGLMAPSQVTSIWSHNTQERYVQPRRRAGFLSWSWAGWEGGVDLRTREMQYEMGPEILPYSAFLQSDGGDPLPMEGIFQR